MLSDFPRCFDHITCLDERNVASIESRFIAGPVRKFSSFHRRDLRQTDHLPVSRDGAEAGDVAPLGMLAGEAAGEQIVEQGVAQVLVGGDDRLGALDGVVDAIQHGGDGPLLRQGREENRI